MAWRKLKNIILLILVALNMALALMIGGPALSDRYREGKAEQAALTFLAQKGIEFGDVQPPDPGELGPKTVMRDLEEEARIAENLLGGDAVQENRGGEVYRYTSPLGVVQFHSDGAFWAQFAPSAYPVLGEASEAALELLSKMGFQGEIVAEKGENSVVVQQVWEESHLFSLQATVIWENDAITDITGGRRLYGTPQPDPGRQTITRATALIDFYNGLNRLGDVCRQVNKIVPGYLSSTSLSRQMELAPVWHITTDTGAYRLDLVSGEVERMS